jgi:hypothetical protein
MDQVKFSIIAFEDEDVSGMEVAMKPPIAEDHLGKQTHGEIHGLFLRHSPGPQAPFIRQFASVLHVLCRQDSARRQWPMYLPFFLEQNHIIFFSVFLRDDMKTKVTYGT